MRISAKTNRYSDIIKQHLAKGIKDPYTILLALLQEFINKAQTLSFLYVNTHKHAAFCKSCFTDEKKTEQKRADEKSTHPTKQKLAPKFDNIKATLDALNTYCKGKEIDSSGEFAMMLHEFFSVYSHFDLEKSLKSKLPSLDCLEVLMDVPSLEAKLSQLLLIGGEEPETLQFGIKSLFRLMSTQQKKVWVATQLRDLRTSKKTELSRVQYYACCKLYESRNDIPSACWPEIIACLTDCLTQESFERARPIAFKLIAENASYIPKALWPKVIEKFLFFVQQSSASDKDVYSLFTGNVATYIPEEFWPAIIVQIYKTPLHTTSINDVRDIISNHINHVPKDIMPTFLQILVIQLCSTLSGGWANDERLLNQCLPLLNKEQWDKEIIPFVLMRISFSPDAIKEDQYRLVKRIVPHIPKDSSLWPALIEKVFCMKDDKLITSGDITAAFAAQIPAKYWNGIITFLSSKWQENPVSGSAFFACAPHIPASEWRSIFTILKSQVGCEVEDSKEYEDSKYRYAKQMLNSYPINAISALGLGLGVMADDLKAEVVQWLLDQFKESNDKNVFAFVKLFKLAVPHVSKDLISKVIDTLLSNLEGDRWDEHQSSFIIETMAEYVNLFAVHESHAKLWTEFLNNCFGQLERIQDIPEGTKHFYKAIVKLANIIPKEHWQPVIDRLITHLRTDSAEYARYTLIKCIPAMPAAARLNVFKSIITSLQGDYSDKTDTVGVELGKIIIELPEALRPDFINVLLSELENKKTRNIIFGALMHCKEAIPTALLGDVSKAILKYDGDIFNFLYPPFGLQIPSEIRPKIIEVCAKLLTSEEKGQRKASWPQIKASITMAQYPDLIPESLRPKLISSLIAGLLNEDADIRLLAAQSLASCHAFISEKHWTSVIEIISYILERHNNGEPPESLFALFEVLAPKIPQNSWEQLRNILCRPPNSGICTGWDRVAKVAGKALTLCIPHLPKGLRFDFCKKLLANIQANILKHDYDSSNPLIEPFQRLVPMLERDEYIYIMSTLTGKITSCEKEKKEESNDWFNDAVAVQLQVLADVHEHVGVERALDAVLPENIEKLVFGLFG